MAILPSQIQFRPLNSAVPYASGALHDVFPAGQVGGATDYAWCEVYNSSALTWTTPKAWLQLDPGGAAVALSVADATPRATSYLYAGITIATLAYSTPTTLATGLALPTLGPAQRCLLAIRRTLTGATAIYPESNSLIVEGDSPL